MTIGNLNDGKLIRHYHPCSDGSTLLVCFPHTGGSANYYFPLSKGLAPAIEVLALQYPGRQDRHREPFVDNIPALADQIFEALLPWSHRPFNFFGHSMGATLAFEVARRFQERTETGPLRLLASGRRAPPRYRFGDMHLRDDAGIVAELRKAGGTESRALADPDVLEMILSVVDLRVFPGGHFYLETCQPDVIETIRAALREFPPAHAETEVRCEI